MTAYADGLPDDKHVMFETRRRQEEMNKNFNLKSVHFVGYHYIIVSQCTLRAGSGRFRPDPARKLSANLYDQYHCCVYSEKHLMMDRGNVRNM